MTSQPRQFHLLLIGIDAYRSKPLKGCVNDIDAIERLLLDPPGIGLPVDRFRVTRLAAALPDAVSTSRFTAQTQPPTRANIVAALRELSGPAVTPEDRVLIYYSGHGSQQRWADESWHESIVPMDEQPISDVEFNAWLNAIAKTVQGQTVDLTAVLDCCHSAGAFRDAVVPLTGDEGMTVRSIGRVAAAVPIPDLTAIPGPSDPTTSDTGVDGLRLEDPRFVVLAACLADELAGEKTLDGRRHGNLTRALLESLAQRDAAARATLRWADLWPSLLVAVRRCGAAALTIPSQNPWLTGRAERRVFGGPWQPRDPGFAVIHAPAATGGYSIAAGRLMGLSVGAELNVYGPDEPLRFPAADSDEDQAARIGRLCVVEAGLAECRARPPQGMPEFVPPEGARARLVKAGEPERLRVHLQPFNLETAALLEGSGLLQVAAAPVPDTEVTVTGQPAEGWLIANEVEADVARVPEGQVDALREGLESYARYNQVLRLGRLLRVPNEAHGLSLRLLQVLAPTPGEGLRQEVRREAPRGEGGNYDLPEGFCFCIAIDNHRFEALIVTVFNCTAGGKVEYLGDRLVRGRTRELLWLGDEVDTGFKAWPSRGRSAAIDRLVAIGSTRRDASLTGMAVADDVQDIVDRHIAGVRRDVRRLWRPKAPAELWTATTCSLRISQNHLGTA